MSASTQHRADLRGGKTSEDSFTTSKSTLTPSAALCAVSVDRKNPRSQGGIQRAHLSLKCLGRSSAWVFLLCDGCDLKGGRIEAVRKIEGRKTRGVYLSRDSGRQGGTGPQNSTDLWAPPVPQRCLMQGSCSSPPLSPSAFPPTPSTILKAIITIPPNSPTCLQTKTPNQPKFHSSRSGRGFGPFPILWACSFRRGIASTTSITL